jgi:hypothetical protein
MIVIPIVRLVKFVVNEVLSPIVVTASINGPNKKIRSNMIFFFHSGYDENNHAIYIYIYIYIIHSCHSFVAPLWCVIGR